jgi:hypothetical protein
MPAAALTASSSSVGAALAAARVLPAAAGRDLIAIADAAFVHGADVANVTAGVVAIVGALLALRFLPGTPPVRPAVEVAEDSELIIAAPVTEARAVFLPAAREGSDDRFNAARTAWSPTRFRPSSTEARTADE